jgi:hypothetical protein
MLIILYNTFIFKLVTKIKKMLKRLANVKIEARPFIKGIKLISSVLNFPISDDD